MNGLTATIPSNYTRLIARELGLSVKQLPELLRGSGLSVDQLLQESGLLTPPQQVVILRNAIGLSVAPDFGLRLGQRLTPLSHGAMGFMAYSSPDLFTALQAIQTFLPTRMSFAQLELAEADGYLECAVRYEFPLDEGVRRCMCESLAAMFFAVAEFIVGRGLEEAQTCFVHAAPEYQARYARYLPGKISFAAPRFMIRFPLAVARVPNASANHENYLLAMQQCEAMLAQIQGQNPGYATRVKKLMLSHPPGTLGEDEAAAELFVSKRTLARKLAAEGTGYRELRDEVLSQQAGDYLRQSELSVEAIAVLLNYHDSANFRRAFRRWYGMPPNHYRRAFSGAVAVVV